ncbi:MAG: signal peptidase II, partial [Firmicutes bacterium]|nr:signal peptidase II [Candidatus Colimorpha enterica]
MQERSKLHQLILLIAELLIAAVAVVLDVITKKIAVNALKGGGHKAFLPGFIDFVYVENTGMAFGMAEGARWFFITVTFVIIIAIAVYLIVLRKTVHPLTAVAMAMVVGGGIGNQIDRISLGYVVDFIHFDFDFPVLHEFPVFNVADSFVTVAAILLVISIIFFDKSVLTDDKKNKDKKCDE